MKICDECGREIDRNIESIDDWEITIKSRKVNKRIDLCLLCWVPIATKLDAALIDKEVLQLGWLDPKAAVEYKYRTPKVLISDKKENKDINETQ